MRLIIMMVYGGEKEGNKKMMVRVIIRGIIEEG